MTDAFVLRALAAGIGIALIAGPLGCFVVWRRMAYFGDTMAHAGLLGIALSLLLEVNMVAAVFAVALAVAAALVGLERRAGLSADSLLGILAHSTLSIGLVLVAMMPWVRTDLMGYLFGDILSVTMTDIAIIWIGGVIIVGALASIWRPLLAGTVNRDLAYAEGLNPDRARLVFMLLLALMIAIAMKIVGILLITALLIIPAAAARRFATSPEMMAALAAIAGCLSVSGGLAASLELDTPAAPSMVVAALIIFLAGFAARGRLLEQGGA
ncbi:MAG: zinc ABC transporter permease subunit ZnuB [Rhodobiaceae bacterium]|nr:zinc ABC transporter permease subunit ZnuB [Rhodobiaceae bacterium]MCC0055210.1 zinc ABC transporter permease subunit ZnuB [Rhodobiaceae bacterium]